MGENALDRAGVEAVSKMPSRDELISSIVGCIGAPAANIAGVLGAPSSNIASIFLQLKKELHEATEGRVICNEARWNTT